MNFIVLFMTTLVMLALTLFQSGYGRQSRRPRSVGPSQPVYLHRSKRQILPLHATDTKAPPSLFTNCKLQKNELVFEVLPGLGWDNLRNVEMSRVLELDYTGCLLTEDFKYLIPASMNVVPLKASEMNVMSEKITHFKDYHVLDAKSINRELTGPVKGVTMGGGYSNEKKKAKREQTNKKSTMLRTTLRDRRYQIIAQPEALKLTAVFHRRLMNIADHLIHSLGKSNPWVEYLSQCIIRDFGTHYIDSMDAGALMSRVEHMSSKDSMHRDEVSSSSRKSASFAFIVSFSYESKKASNNTNFRKDEEKKTSSTVYTLGGAPFGPGVTMEDWQSEISNNLVAIDRRGKYLYSLITKYNFPTLPPLVIYKLQEAIRNATNLYVRLNTVSGCLDFNNKNFDPHALVDDPTRCDDSAETSGFDMGGHYYSIVYPAKQSWQKDTEVIFKNPVTGKQNCPPGTTSIQLASELYWCARSKNQKAAKGYVFGGIFSRHHKVRNPLTKGFSCPQKYFQYKFTERATICYTKDTGKDVLKLGFGGFFNCHKGNPMAQGAMSCPTGFRRQLAFTENRCSLYYCVGIVNLQKIGQTEEEIKLPPFTKLDKDGVVNYFKVKTLHLGADHHWLNVDGKWQSKRGNGDYLLQK